MIEFMGNNLKLENKLLKLTWKSVEEVQLILWFLNKRKESEVFWIIFICTTIDRFYALQKKRQYGEQYVGDYVQTISYTVSLLITCFVVSFVLSIDTRFLMFYSLSVLLCISSIF